jgi:hypothetical protein
MKGARWGDGVQASVHGKQSAAARDDGDGGEVGEEVQAQAMSFGILLNSSRCDGGAGGAVLRMRMRIILQSALDSRVVGGCRRAAGSR